MTFETTCFDCVLMHWQNSTPGWSEYTPGEKLEMGCFKNHWEFKPNETSQEEYRDSILKANNCPDFEPRLISKSITLKTTSGKDLLLQGKTKDNWLFESDWVWTTKDPIRVTEIRYEDQPVKVNVHLDAITEYQIQLNLKSWSVTITQRCTAQRSEDAGV